MLLLRTDPVLHHDFTSVELGDIRQGGGGGGRGGQAAETMFTILCSSRGGKGAAAAPTRDDAATPGKDRKEPGKREAQKGQAKNRTAAKAQAPKGPDASWAVAFRRAKERCFRGAKGDGRAGTGPPGARPEGAAMNSPETEERRADWKSDLLRRLHDPIQLRIGVLAVVLAVGYGGVYLPLSAQVAETSRKLEQDQRRLALARSIEQLQRQYRRFQHRIPQHVNTEEWVQYILDGIRQFPLVMNLLDRRPPRGVGPTRRWCCTSTCGGRFSIWTISFAGWKPTNGCSTLTR